MGNPHNMPYMAYPIAEGEDFGCLQVTLANSPHPSTGIIVPSEVLKLLRLAIPALVQRSLLITFLKSCDIYIRFQPPLGSGEASRQLDENSNHLWLQREGNAVYLTPVA